MSHLSKPVTLAVLLFALVACAPLQPYDGVVRTPKTEIEVFEAGREPTREYKVIMSFSERGDTGDEADSHRSFVAKAKKLGADAIILKPSVNSGFDVGFMGGKSQAAYSAIAIVYK